MLPLSSTADSPLRLRARHCERRRGGRCDVAARGWAPPHLRALNTYQVSTKERRPQAGEPDLAPQPRPSPPAEANACTILERVEAGSITSSISKWTATLSALPCS